MAQGKITERALDGLRSAAARADKLSWLWDTETKGFGARCSPTGSLGFVFQSWEGGKGGKARRITLTSVTLEDARAEAQSKRVEANKGELTSPREQRLKQQREQLQQKTIKEAVELYLEEKRPFGLCTQASKDGGRYWGELEQQFNNQILPYFKEALKLNPETKRITAVTKEDLRSLLKSFNDRPGSKVKVYSALSPMFKYLLSEGYIASNPLISVPKPKLLKSRDRTLSKAEIKAFWSASGQLGYPWTPFYRLLLLTAQRREEVAAIEWSELDLEGATWVIPSSKTKNNKEHIVHLSSQALTILNGLEKKKDTLTGKVSRYLFTTTFKTHVSGYARAKERINKLLPEDMPSWRIHDLRRTAKTGFASLGVPKEVSEKILNHVSNSASDLEAIYNRYEYLAERKEALAKWGEYVLELVSS